MTGKFTHVDEHGAARIVDITARAATQRRALARCRVMVGAEVTRLLGNGPRATRTLEEARVAGTMAAKRTSTLIPLCHPIGINMIHLSFSHGEGFVQIETATGAFERTGLEMEALTACAVAALTIVGEFHLQRTQTQHRIFDPVGEVGRALRRLAAGGGWQPALRRVR